MISPRNQGRWRASLHFTAAIPFNAFSSLNLIYHIFQTSQAFIYK